MRLGRRASARQLSAESLGEEGSGSCDEQDRKLERASESAGMSLGLCVLRLEKDMVHGAQSFL